MKSDKRTATEFQLSGCGLLINRIRHLDGAASKARGTTLHGDAAHAAAASPPHRRRRCGGRGRGALPRGEGRKGACGVRPGGVGAAAAATAQGPLHLFAALAAHVLDERRLRLVWVLRLPLPEHLREEAGGRSELRP